MAEHNPIVRLSVSEKRSLRACIDAKCAECMGCTADHIEQGFRELVRSCTARNCPLWTVRPYQRKRAE